MTFAKYAVAVALASGALLKPSVIAHEKTLLARNCFFALNDPETGIREVRIITDKQKNQRLFYFDFGDAGSITGEGGDFQATDNNGKIIPLDQNVVSVLKNMMEPLERSCANRKPSKPRVSFKSQLQFNAPGQNT